MSVLVLGNMEIENQDESNTREEQLVKELNETKMKLQEAIRKIDDLQKELCSTKEIEILKEEPEPKKIKLGCTCIASGSTMRLESFIVVFGKYEHGLNTEIDAFKINLNRPDEVFALDLKKLPFEVKSDMTAAVYDRSIFVTGIGEKSNEIWKIFDARCLEWKKCAYLKTSRSGHSVAFIDHTLYVCGGVGSVGYNGAYVDVEAYDAKNNKCYFDGKLAEAVYKAGNCVPYKASLYIFGGKKADQQFANSVQVYDTKFKSGIVLAFPMPRSEAFFRAVSFKNYVILLGEKSCFLYYFDTKSWAVRDQFKTGVVSFGMTVHDENLFVIGGRDSKWDRQDDVRYVPVSNIMSDEPIEWKHHAKLPKPSPVHFFGKLEFLVQPI